MKVSITTIWIEAQALRIRSMTLRWSVCQEVDVEVIYRTRRWLVT